MATRVDLRRMLSNDQRLTSIFLTFSSRLDSEDFRRAVTTNTVLEEVVISADEFFFQECPEDCFQDVLEALGRLPRLRKLAINSYPNCRGLVPMKSIYHIVQGAKGLQSLSLQGLQLTGCSQDFVGFAEQVQQMLYLRAFCLVECNAVLRREKTAQSSLHVPQSAVFEKTSLVSSPEAAVGLFDSLLMSLSILPCLEAIYLEAKDQGGLGSLSVPSATSLCFSASLRLLRIRNLDLTDAHVTSMASLLEMNHNIRSLDLGSMSEFKRGAAQAIGKMMRTNTALIHLELSMDQMIQDDCADILAQGLRQNKCLRSFALVARDPNALKKQRLSTKARKSMLEMLQYNYSLRKFFLFRKYPLSREFKLYSSLNNLGRGELLQSTNQPEDWIQKLATVTNDLNSIFYFVSNNPTLCMTSTASKRKRCTIKEDSRLSKKQRVSSA